MGTSSNGRKMQRKELENQQIFLYINNFEKLKRIYRNPPNNIFKKSSQNDEKVLLT